MQPVEYQIQEIKIKIFGWTGDNAPSDAFLNSLERAARFMNCRELEYRDGKEETYRFINECGDELTVESGHNVHPSSGWIHFDTLIFGNTGDAR